MRFLAIGLLMFSAAGCGGGVAPTPKTVQVEGLYTYKNIPVTKGKVTLQSTKQAGDGHVSRPATGQLCADGKFTLSSFKAGDGVMPGEYRVTVESMDEVSMEEFNEGKKSESLIPKKYSDIKTTDLTATIPDQAEPYPLTLELKD
jgi:hypothetical protein